MGDLTCESCDAGRSRVLVQVLVTLAQAFGGETGGQNAESKEKGGDETISDGETCGKDGVVLNLDY